MNIFKATTVSLMGLKSSQTALLSRNALRPIRPIAVTNIFHQNRHTFVRLSTLSKTPSSVAKASLESESSESNLYSPSDDDDQHRSNRSPSPFFLLCHRIKAMSIPSLTDSAMDNFQKILSLAEIYSDIKNEIYQRSKKALCQRIRDSRQEEKIVFNKHDPRNAMTEDVKVRFIEVERELTTQIYMKCREEVLRDWGLSGEMFGRLKRIRQKRNTLVHPVLNPDDKAIVLEEWIQEEERTMLATEEAGRDTEADGWQSRHDLREPAQGKQTKKGAGQTRE